MFSLFKKKDRPSCCLGVILKERMSQEDLDSCVDFFNKVFNGKVFKSEQINLISDKLKFDIKEYYFFTDNEKWNTNEHKIDISLLYRFKGSKLISGDEIEKMILNIDSEIFYNRSSIEKLSEKYGFSVFDRCIFESYIIHICICEKDNINVKVVVSRK